MAQRMRAESADKWVQSTFGPGGFDWPAKRCAALSAALSNAGASCPCAVSCACAENSHLEQVRQAFAVFDTDNTGALDRAQFKEVLMFKREDGTPPLSEEEVNVVFDGVDTDNSGLIELREFIAWYKKAAPTPAKPEGAKAPCICPCKGVRPCQLAYPTKAQQVRAESADKWVRKNFGPKGFDWPVERYAALSAALASPSIKLSVAKMPKMNDGDVDNIIKNANLNEESAKCFKEVHAAFSADADADSDSDADDAY